MGHWHISIQGVGAHHNKDYPQDANRMAAAFVQELLNAGHQLDVATFSHGRRDDYPLTRTRGPRDLDRGSVDALDGCPTGQCGEASGPQEPTPLTEEELVRAHVEAARAFANTLTDALQRAQAVLETAVASGGILTLPALVVLRSHLRPIEQQATRYAVITEQALEKTLAQFAKDAA